MIQIQPFLYNIMRRRSDVLLLVAQRSRHLYPILGLMHTLYTYCGVLEVEIQLFDGRQCPGTEFQNLLRLKSERVLL